MLPASHIGGKRYMQTNYHDCMAICCAYGPPDKFTTMTCNSNWPEIKEALRYEPGQKPCDRSDVVVRVFHMKLQEYLEDIEGRIFGCVRAVSHTNEFQKRGLPHSHIFVWQADTGREPSVAEVDQHISVELPDPLIDPLGFSLVQEFMMHGPCGPANPDSPCMKEGKCSKSYPKPFRKGASSSNGSSLANDGSNTDNQPDHDGIDEIAEYIRSRYLSWCESIWRLLGFEIHEKFPSVERLYVHLHGLHFVMVHEQANLQAAIDEPGSEKSMLTEWFVANQMSTLGHNLTYCEFPSRFTWNAEDKVWNRQKKGFKLGRLRYVHPTTSETFYLRMLLMVVVGLRAMKMSDLMKVCYTQPFVKHAKQEG